MMAVLSPAYAAADRRRMQIGRRHGTARL